jgi:RNA polymerase sigma-70 factor (ECF subfamily)
MADRNAFDNLAVPLLDSLYRVARTLSGNEHDAQDLVQVTYLKAVERFGTYQAGTNCKAWMMTIMRNTWIDQLRHRKVVGTTVSLEEDLLPAQEQPSDVGGGLEGILERFSDQQVINVLMELPDQQRLALFLSDVESMDQNAVAKVLDIPVGTVKSRVSRARAVLREKLEAHARDMGFLGRRPCHT